MQKPFCLSLFMCLALSGCGLFKASEAWSTVRAVRVDTRGEADPSAAYAAQLSERLTTANIEHQVVTYQFRCRTRLNEEGIATRTAVVYRDEVSARYPWWLMDERLSQPFWLPAGDLAQQISFYLRTPVELVETKGGARDGGGKAMSVALREDAKTARASAASRVGPIAFRTAPARIAVRATPMELQDKKRAWLESRVAAQQPPAAKHRTALVTSFRAIHGTAFDPRSPTDRRKMEQMRQSGRRVARAD